MYITEVGNIISHKSGHLNRAYLEEHYIVDNSYFKSLLQVSVVQTKKFTHDIIISCKTQKLHMFCSAS